MNTATAQRELVELIPLVHLSPNRCLSVRRDAFQRLYCIGTESYAAFVERVMNTLHCVGLRIVFGLHVVLIYEDQETTPAKDL